MYRRRKDTREVALAGNALGVASIGIGLTELLAPRFVENMLGIEDRQTNRGILQVLGTREVMHGVGLLTARDSNGQLSGGIWSRVAGDLLDTALLGMAATKTRRPGSFAATSAAVAAIGLADLYYALKSSGSNLLRR